MGVLLLLVLLLFIACLGGFYRTKDNKRGEDGYIVHDEEGNYVYEYKREYDFTDIFCHVWSGVIFVLSVITLFFSVIAILTTNFGSYGRYEVLVMKKQVIEYRLERIDQGSYEDFMLSGDFGSLESTYDDMIAFNTEIIAAKRYSDSFWIGWFYNPYYKNIDLIVIE